MTLYVRQEKRHRCIEQSFGLCGRRQGWDDLREKHWNMYIIICETDRQSRFDAWGRAFRAGALGWPWGMGWGGRWEEGSGWGTHVYLWQIHFDIWQNQYNIIKLKNTQTNKQKVNGLAQIRQSSYIKESSNFKFLTCQLSAIFLTSLSFSFFM